MKTTIREFLTSMGGVDSVFIPEGWKFLLDFPVEAKMVSSEYKEGSPCYASRGRLQVSCGGEAVIGFYQGRWEKYPEDQRLPGAVYIVREKDPDHPSWNRLTLAVSG